MIRIFGTMTDPSGSPVPGAIIELRAISSTSEVLFGSTLTYKCDQDGAYSFHLAIGTYDAYAQNDRCGDMDYIGTAMVSVNSVDGDIHSLLVDGGVNITPPMLDRALEAAQRAESAAVHTAADKVSTGKDAESARICSVAAQEAKNISVAAADTATQKAASAATHDASAHDAAARAENAASAVVGAVLDGGECDLSAGVYPLPITVAGKKYSTIWYVAVAGAVSGVTFDVGDLLRYTTAKSGYYFKVDAKDDVYSVNGEKGAVTVTPNKIGAETAGVALQLVEQHASKPSAHQMSGVAGLNTALSALTTRLEGLESWPQSGSNANGNWVKYKDGTMICTFSGTINISIPNAYGVLYQNLTDPFIFPATFIEPPVVTVGEMRWLGMVSWGTVAGTPTKTQVILRILDVGQRAVGPTNVSYTAIGRWK